MLTLVSPLFSLGGSLLDVRIALEVIALLFAIRLYRVNRQQSFRFLLWAFLCLVIPQVGLFAFTGIQGYVFPQISNLSWIYYADPISFIVFFVFIILSLKSFRRERSASMTPNV